ncbi:uncharacterized protein ACRADG_006789 [Cochliomyia hominivorax]
MHKNTLWLIVALLCIYFSLVLCGQETTAIQQLESEDSNVKLSDSTDLEEEARTRRRHHHYLYSWGLYGLAIAYLVKIKVVVVAFFVGSAIYLGLRYLWPHRCGGIGGIYKEGDIVLDHPPSFHHHDHIPYALEHDHYHDHHFDTSSFSSSSGPSWSSSSGPSWSSSSSGPSSFGPYSAYSSHAFTESEGPVGPPDDLDGPPDGIYTDSPPSTFRRKRNVLKTKEEVKQDDSSAWDNLARQMVVTEERIGEFMFDFLGLDTPACRRRFICEMEFKSKRNPLTAMGFRIIGRSFFAKYTNDKNPLKQAQNFGECAAVNADCVFIENNEDLEQETPASHDNQAEEHNVSNTEDQQESLDDKTEATTENNSWESNDIIEQENEENLKTELRRNSYRRRLRGDRYLKLI